MIRFLKKHKTKILISTAVVAVLTAAFFLGEKLPVKQNNNVYTDSNISQQSSIIKEETSIPQSISENKTESVTELSSKESQKNNLTQSKAETGNINVESVDIHNSKSSYQSTVSTKTESSVISFISQTQSSQSTIETSINSEPSKISSNINSESSITETSKQKQELQCTVSISCSTILDNMEKLSKSKQGLVPSNGWILKEITVEYSDGETAFDILKKECQENKIHLEFSNTPLYNSVYIEGINNLYEFDCGNTSGWIWLINGKQLNYSCSEYKINNGDKIEWLYSCDLGKDISSEYNY